MKNNYRTPRLLIRRLKLADAGFICELVNSPGWLRFIGDRNVNNKARSTEYTRKIINNPDINYWVVGINNGDTSIGIVTFIKRDYLESHDIGFAFLPGFTGQGYAFEATNCILSSKLAASSHSIILATTVRNNVISINLLIKLGFVFSKPLKKEKLRLYEITADKYHIDRLTKAFFEVFTNKNQRLPRLDLIPQYFMADAIIIKKNRTYEEVYNLQSFVTPRKEVLSNGNLTEFEEWEESEKTLITANIGQRMSQYKKRGRLNGVNFESSGTKSFQFVKTKSGWRICALIWEDQ